MTSDFLFFSALTLAIIATQITQQRASPVGYILNRWIRWTVFSLCGAKLLSDFTGRPFAILAAILALVWLALETLYNWLAIKALSTSELPLFPKFTANQDDPDLLLQPRFQKIQTWLRENNFKRVQSLKTAVTDNLSLFANIYQNPANTLRLQITLLPQPRNRLATAFSLSTNTTAGDTYVTDNHFLPFGGFYPENWQLDRRPLTRSLSNLLRRHQNRLAKSNATATPWTSEPLADLNAHQADLERINTELGFLVQRTDREELGAITPAGRYRIWKEYWLLNYLGRSAKYL